MRSRAKRAKKAKEKFKNTQGEPGMVAFACHPSAEAETGRFQERKLLESIH